MFKSIVSCNLLLSLQWIPGGLIESDSNQYTVELELQWYESAFVYKIVSSNSPLEMTFIRCFIFNCTLKPINGIEFSYMYNSMQNLLTGLVLDMYMYVASSTSEHLMNQILPYQKLPQQILPTVYVPVSQNKTVPCMSYMKQNALLTKYFQSRCLDIRWSWSFCVCLST